MDSALLAQEVGYAVSQGASYAEARFHKRVVTEIIARNGRLVATAERVEKGVGVRVLRGGVLSFSATVLESAEGVRRTFDSALAQARARRPLVEKFNPRDRVGAARVEVSARKPFDSMSVDEKIAFITGLWRTASDAVHEAKLVSLSIEYVESVEEKIIVTSDGGQVYSRIPRIAFFILATLSHPERGSIQRSIELGAVGGLEWIDTWRVEELLRDELSRAENVLLRGVEPPKEPIPVVLGSEVVGLIVHESAGHPMEADRIWGREAAQAGESFVKQGMIGRERVGNRNATVVDDPTIPGSFGFYLYDDEAVAARPRYIYLEGLINEPLHSRWSAALYGVESNAAARAMDYSSEPIPRMANTYLEPGNWRFEELLEEAKDGVYVRSYMEWNIDDVRWGQRYVGLEAYRIRRGELSEPVRNPVLEFTTRQFYSSIKAKSRDLKFYAGMCGKSEPPQGVPVWFGGPDVLLEPMRLRPS